MIRWQNIILIILFVLTFASSFSQTIETIPLAGANDKNDSYLAIRPASKEINAAVVLLTSFLPPDRLLAETKLQNTAFANNILTVVASMQQKLYADSVSVNRISQILSDIRSRFAVDTARFVLAGFDEAGTIALRYTELAYEHPETFPVQPKAVFGIDTPVDLFGVWKRAENQVKKNYWPGAVGDATFYLNMMTKENGTIYNNAAQYEYLTPFTQQSDSAGHEKFLKNVAVRLYYDIDATWQLQERRNSLYDTKIPDGTELIKRLLLLGNDRAELVAAKQPGMRSNGERSPTTLSIIDEVECVQWIKKSLGIFDPVTWKPPYHLSTPEGWTVERFSLPPDFAPAIPYTGVEDIRFAPGWGDVNSEEHWSYGFVWWLNGVVPLKADSLQRVLQSYYNGLVGRNIVSRHIPQEKVVPTTVSVEKITTASKDVSTFRATISMLDYHTQLPITLHVMVHVKSNPSAAHTAVYIEISPQPSSNQIWQTLDGIGNSFQPGE